MANNNTEWSKKWIEDVYVGQGNVRRSGEARGKSPKQFEYDPIWGPLAGGTGRVGSEPVLDNDGSALDAATDNRGQNSLIRLPGSAKALTVDGTGGDFFPSISDPNQIFPFYFKSIEIIDFNFGYIPFIGEINFTINEAAMFQATISQLRETVTPQLGTKHYFGRSEPVRTYQYTERRLELEFTVYAPSFAGLQHVKERVNFLVKSCYPTYDAGSGNYGVAGALYDFLTGRGNSLDKSQDKYKEPPIMMITLGDLFVDVPGVIETVDIDWVGETGRWELEKGARMPQLAKITMTYYIMHKLMPERTLGADFYPDLQVDELYATQGQGGSFAKGQLAQGTRMLFQDIDKGDIMGKLGELSSNLVKTGNPFGNP